MKAQKDTAIHLLGVGTGYFTDPDLAGDRGEFNLIYIYSKANFFARLETSVAPFTNFGVAYKIYPTIGVTTKLKHSFSWHGGVGFGFLKSTNTKGAYDFSGVSPIGNTGIIYRCSKKIKVAFDASLGMYNLSQNSSAPMGYRSEDGYMPFLDISLYYSF